MASQRLTSALVDKRVAVERQNEAQQKVLTAMVAENSRQREVNRAETLVARKRRTNAACTIQVFWRSLKAYLEFSTMQRKRDSIVQEQSATSLQNSFRCITHNHRQF